MKLMMAFFLASGVLLVLTLLFWAWVAVLWRGGRK
jgi:hypothetical protein